MTYIRSKMINGHGPYYYEVESVREGDKVHQKYVKYLGTTGPTGSEPAKDLGTTEKEPVKDLGTTKTKDQILEEWNINSAEYRKGELMDKEGEEWVTKPRIYLHITGTSDNKDLGTTELATIKKELEAANPGYSVKVSKSRYYEQDIETEGSPIDKMTKKVLGTTNSGAARAHGEFEKVKKSTATRGIGALSDELLQGEEYTLRRKQTEGRATSKDVEQLNAIRSEMMFKRKIKPWA